MHEHRNDGLRIQREKLWSELLAAKDIDDVPGPREALFLEHETNLRRACRRAVMMQLEHGIQYAALAPDRGDPLWRNAFGDKRARSEGTLRNPKYLADQSLGAPPACGAQSSHCRFNEVDRMARLPVPASLENGVSRVLGNQGSVHWRAASTGVSQ
jgi:hypothetical protein